MKMEEQEEVVTKVNLMGRIFELPQKVVNQIPFLVDAMTDSVPLSGVYRIYRSPLVFDHVIAFLLDRAYPFPSELEYELKFYRIAYEQNELSHFNEKLLDKSDILEQSIKQIMLNMKVKSYSCSYPDCKSSSIQPTCRKHRENCLFQGCQEQRHESNYCQKHQLPNLFCHENNCIYWALKNTKHCLVHTKK